MKSKSRQLMFGLMLVGGAAGSLAASLVWAQSETATDPVAEYRAMFGDDNPAALWITRGQDLWNQVRGPKGTSLAKSCDLGLGAGVVKGAYAHLPRYFAGDVKPRQQPHPDRATYSRKLTKDDGAIDWTKPAEVLEREVRAFAGWPKSRTVLGGIPLAVTQASVHTGDSAKPGQITVEGSRLLVGTGQDWLEILAVQPDGKKEMPVKAFLAGYKSRLV